MKIKNRQRVLVILAGVTVALLVSDRLIITPLTRAWKERSLRLTDLRNSVNQGELLLDREAAIRERWSFMRTNTLPDNASSAENEVIKAFDRWSQDSSLSILSIRPQLRRTEDDYMTLECRADGFGSMEAIARFLYEVEKDPLPLKVEAVEITTREKSGSQLSIGLQVSGLLLTPK